MFYVKDVKKALQLLFYSGFSVFLGRKSENTTAGEKKKKKKKKCAKKTFVSQKHLGNR